tara:strand:- start:201 stop:464 length:264 start_codon:yes stop_codon:yes gene_type:complete
MMDIYNVVQPPGTIRWRQSISSKYLTQPHDGQPGTLWDDFEERLLNVLAGQSCENGWSLADCVRQVDEGSAGGPPMPGAAKFRDVVK